MAESAEATTQVKELETKLRQKRGEFADLEKSIAKRVDLELTIQ